MYNLEQINVYNLNKLDKLFENLKGSIMKSYTLLTSALISVSLLTGCSDEPEQQEEVKVEEVDHAAEVKVVTSDLETSYADLRAKTDKALSKAKAAVEALEAVEESQAALQEVIEQLDTVVKSEEAHKANASEMVAKELREAAARLEGKAK
jgi:3-hydroxyacyl-CoA dehydrogenase